MPAANINAPFGATQRQLAVDHDGRNGSNAKVFGRGDVPHLTWGEESLGDVRHRFSSLKCARTKEEAGKLKIEHPGYYFRSFSGKRNYAPPMSESTWFRFTNIELNNDPDGWIGGGDQVGVVTSWTHPGARELDFTPDKIVAIQQIVRQHRYREDVRAEMWVGKAVALALGLDLSGNRDQIKKLLQRLFRDRFLELEAGQGEDRHSDMFVIVGPGPSGAGRGGYGTPRTNLRSSARGSAEVSVPL